MIPMLELTHAARGSHLSRSVCKTAGCTSLGEGIGAARTKKTPRWKGRPLAGSQQLLKLSRQLSSSQNSPSPRRKTVRRKTSTILNVVKRQIAHQTGDSAL